MIDGIRQHERAALTRRLNDRAKRFAWARAWTFTTTTLGTALAATALLGLNREAGRRASAERVARARQQGLEVTLRSIGDAVITADMEGRVVFSNPVAEALTGWRLDDARGQPIDRVFNIVNEETRATVESPVTRALREGRVVGLANHTVLLTKDGREVPIDDSGAPICDVDGACLGVVLVFRDITARRLAERERERSVALREAQAKAEAENRAKDEFLAVLSHELRSPLHAMLGWLSILKKGLAAGKSVDRAVEAVERNLESQTRLVDDLLDVSRIVSDKLTIDEAPVDLAAAARAAIDDARSAAEAKGVTISSSIACPPAPLIGDEKRLQQVVTNLLTNAIRFTSRGGLVTVTLETSDDDEAILRVVDTGQGIASSFLPHVFDRFRQSEGGTTRAHGGLGIGLSVVKKLVELHGGRVEAASPGLGRGATFTVRLPLRRMLPVPARAHRASHQLLPGRVDGMIVLLVEDDGDSREALRVQLEEAGAQVHACASAEEGRRAMERALPDIIVSDVGMLGEDGYEFLKKLRARGGKYVPAVALTGFASKQDRDAAARASFDAHVTKPVSAEALLGTLRQLVGGSLQARPA